MLLTKTDSHCIIRLEKRLFHFRVPKMDDYYGLSELEYQLMQLFLENKRTDWFFRSDSLL